jgi:hypothetical protein
VAILQARRVVVAAVLAGAVILAGPAVRTPRAAGQALPSGRDIVTRYVAAIGGESAYRAVRSIHIRGQIAIAAQAITGELDMMSARPQRLRYRVVVAGVGTIETGYDGRVGWSISPITGPELLTGRSLTEAADDAWFDSPLHAPDHVRELTTRDRTEFDGHDAYKVDVVLASGTEQTEYFDTSTGLELGSEATRATPQGNVPTVNILRDYRKFGALLQPTTIVQRALGFEQVMTVTSCEYNTVPDSAFDLPAAIKALIKP